MQRKKLAFLFSLFAFSIISTESRSDQNFKIWSPNFEHGGILPKRHTGDGDNISPALKWTNQPKGTKSFALIVVDPDAQGKIWTHWILFNIPATTNSLSEHAKPNGFMSGATDFFYAQNGIWLYCGPYPPKGDSFHHYNFTLYALDSLLELGEDTERDDLIKAMSGHILGKAMLVGLYKR